MKRSYIPHSWYQNATTFPSVFGKAALTLSLLLAFTMTSFAQTPTYYERVYADQQLNGKQGLALLSGVTDSLNAVDGDIHTASTLTLGVVLLGGNVWQSLIFPSTVPANTPVTIKIGLGSDLLSLLGGITVYTGYNGSPVTVKPLSTLLSLVGAAGVHEVTLVSPTPIDRIAVKFSGALSAAASMQVFDAYYMKETTTPICNSIPVDVIPGVSKGAVSALGGVNGVDNPQNAIDGQVSTYSELQGLVGLLNYTYEKVNFNGYTLPDDSVHVFLSSTGGLLTAGVLKTGFAIVTYKDDQIVDSLTSGTQLLSLTLLTGNSDIGEVSFKPSGPIDAVAVVLGGAVNALNELRVHEIMVRPAAPQINNGSVSVNGDTMAVCSDSTFMLSVNNPQTGMTYNWYDSTGASIQTNTSSLSVGPLPKGIHIYKVTGTRDACTTGSDTATVVVNVTDPEAPTTEPASDTTVCVGDTVVLKASSSQPGITFDWYDAATGGNKISTGQDTIHVIASATATTYYVEARMTSGGCTSATRTAVTVNADAAQTPVIDGAATITQCPGETVTLNVQNPVSGVTYNWYIDSTSNTIVGTGDSFTSASLTDTTTFYVRAESNGSCVVSGSWLASSVTVNVGDLPAPTLVSDTIYASVGQTVDFEILNPITGATYTWTDSASGSTSTGTDLSKSFTAADTYVYYVRVKSGTCTSPDSARAVAIITDVSGAACNYANAQQSPIYTGGILSICALCNVIDPNNAIDGDLTTASNIRINVGVSTYLGQLLKFQHPGKAGDSIRLVLGLPTGITDVDLLQGVRIETYNNGTASGNPVFLNSSVLRLTLLSGNKFEAIIPAQDDYDAVLVSFGGNLNLTALTSLDVYNAEQLIPQPAIAAGEDTVLVCTGSTATLNATAATGTTLEWYADLTGGTVLNTGASYTTPAITDTTTYYVTASRDDCANPNRIPVVVVPAPAASTPDLMADTVDICSGDSATFEIDNPVTGVKYYWYADETATTPVDSGAAFTTPALTSNTSYYVEAQSANCTTPSTRTQAVVAVNTAPQPPVIDGSTVIDLCYGESTTLNIQNPEAGVTYNWYTDTTATGAVIYTGDSYTTDPLMDTTIFYIKASLGSSCDIPGFWKAATVTVNVADSVPTPTLLPDTIYASIGDSVVFHVKDNAGVTYKWYDQATGGTALTNNAVSDTMFVTPTFGSAGTYVYYVEAVNADGCASPVRAKATAIISGPSGADCYVANEQYSPMMSLLCLLCEVDNPLNAVDGDTTTYSNVRGNVSLLGNIAQELKFQHDGKAGDTLQLMLGSSTGLLDLGALDGVRIWFYKDKQLVEGPEQLTKATLELQLLNSTTNKTTVQIVAPVDYDAIALGIGGLAVALKSLYIYQAEQHIVMPTVTADSVTICSGDTAVLSATISKPGNTIVWYDNSGMQVGTGTTFTTDTLTASTTYYVSAMRDGCANPNGIPVVVTVNSGAQASDITITGPTGALCEGDTTQLAAALSTTASGFNNPIFIWYADARLTQPIDTINNLSIHPTQTTTYYVTVQDENAGICENASGDAAQITVQVNEQALPTDISVIGDTAICSGTTTVLTASSSIPGATFMWYTDTTQAPVSTNPALSVTPTDDTVYYVRVSATGYCQSSALAVDVPVAGVTGGADIQIAGNENGFCVGDTVVLKARSTTVNNAVFTWYTDTTQSPIHTGGTLMRPVTAAVTYFVKVTGDNACATGPASGSKQIDVKVNPDADPADIQVSGSATICVGDTTALLVSDNKVTAPVFIWYSDATLTTPIDTAAQLTVHPTTTTDYYVTVQGTNACENVSNAKKVTVTVNTLPTAPIITGPTPNTICYNESATLQVSNGVNGVTYNWYTDTLAAPVHTGTSYTTGNLTDTTTFYVEATNASGCVAAGTFASFTVNVSPEVPSPIVYNDTMYVSVGDSVVFHVKDSTGITYRWYDAATGGNALGNADTLKVGPFGTAGTYTYYVAASNAEGCMSAARAKAVVIVSGPTGVDCYMPNEQQTMYSLLCLACTVEQPLNAIDGDSTTHSDVRANIALLGNSAQYLKFQHPGLTGDTLRIKLGSSAGLLDANLLSGVRIWFFKGGQLVSGPTRLSQSFLNIDLLNNTTSGTTLNLVAPVDFDGIALGIGGGLNLLSSLYIYQVEQHIVMPTVTADSVTICSGESATLSATTNDANNDVVWYDGTGNQIHIGDTYTTGTITNDTTFYVSAIRDGCANPNRIPVVVKVNPSAQASDITVDDATICAGDTTILQASSTTISNGIFVWYSDDQLTDTLYVGSDYEVHPNSTTLYYVTVQGTGICANTPGDAKIVTVTVNPHADSTDIDVNGGGQNNAICEGDTAMLTASSSLPNAQFKWYSDAALSNVLVSGANYKVHPVQTTTYYVGIVSADGYCITLPGAGDSVTVIVNPHSDSTDVDIAGGGQGNAICEGDTTLLTASSTTVSNPVFTWYSDKALTTQIHTGATYKVHPATTTTYYVSVSGDGTCATAAGDAAHVTVIVNPHSDSTDVDIAGGGQGNAICAGDTTVLTASSTTVTNPVFTWYSDKALTTQIHTGATYKVHPATTTTYYVSVSGDGVCAAEAGGAAHVTVYINPHSDSTDVDIAGGGQGNAICAGDTTLLTASSTTVTNPVFTWYSDKALTNSLHIGDTYKVHPAQTTTYYVSVSGDGTCATAAGDAAHVTVIVNPHSDSTDVDIAGGGQGNAICAGDTTLLTASSKTVTNPVFTWYSDKALTTQIHTGATYKVHPATTTTYYVSVSGDGICAAEAGDAAHVTVYINPHSDSTDVDIAGGGQGNAICAGDTTVLTASSTTVTNPVFTWYSDKALTTQIHTGATYKVHPATTTTYYVSVSGDGICAAEAGGAAHVTVYINPHSTPNDITVDGNGNEICAGESTLLKAGSSSVPNPVFNWYSDASLTTLVFTGDSYTVNPTQTTTYYVTVSGDGHCENASGDAKEVKVIVNPPSSAGDISVKGDGNTLCAGESTELQASSTTVSNPVFNWYTDAKLTNKVYTGANYSVSPTQNTTYYVTVLGDGYCETPAGSAKEVTVNVNPPSDSNDISINGNGGAICEGESVTLTASSATVDNPVFTWYSDAGLGTKVHTGATYKVSPQATTTYYITVQGNNKCATPAGDARKVIVTVNELPVKPTVKGPSGSNCAGLAATLEITNVQSGVTYKWYSDANMTDQIGTGASLTSKPLNATTTFYVVALSNSGCTNASGSSSVTVTITTPPAAPSVKAVTVAVCLGAKATFDVDNPVNGVTYKWYTSATGGASIYTGTSFTTAAIQSNTVYYVEAATASGCTNGERTKVTATVIQTPSKPDISAPQGPVCPDEAVVLEVTNPQTGVTYHWYDAETDGTELETGDTYKTEPLSQTTTFYVEAVVQGGCVNTGGRIPVTVQVTTPLPAPQVQVKETTASSVTFEWTPITDATGYKVSMDNGATWTDPSSGITGTTHTVTGLEPLDKVTIIVKALGDPACRNSVPSVAVTGQAKNPLGNKFFIPNAFSPNSDGHNDIWKVYGNTIQDIHIMVYNQYGQKIFESRNINDGWDGTYKGKMQPVGVYVYLVEVTFTDNSTMKKSGSITLIR